MKPTRFYVSIVCFAVAVLLLGSCRRASDVDPAASDTRGRLVADLPAPFYRLLDWSADGQELYYWAYYPLAPINKGNYHLYALNVQTGSRRLVYDDPLYLVTDYPYSQPGQSPDGQFFYVTARRYSSSQPPVYFLYRISARQLNRAVAIDSSYDANSPTNPRVPDQLLSVDGTRLVFQHRPDSIRIHNLTTNTAVAYRASRPVAFSPDASRVLLSRSVGLNPGTLEVSLSDLSEKPINTSLPRDQYPHANSILGIRWSTEGIRYAYSNSVPGPSGLFLWNVTQQKSTLVRAKPDDESYVFMSNAWWSRDGQRIVFRTNAYQFWDDPRRFFYVTDLTTLKSARIATVNPTESERNSSWGPLLLSYDNKQLAYAIGGKVYVIAIP